MILVVGMLSCKLSLTVAFTCDIFIYLAAETCHLHESKKLQGRTLDGRANEFYIYIYRYGVLVDPQADCSNLTFCIR